MTEKKKNQLLLYLSTKKSSCEEDQFSWHACFNLINLLWDFITGL